MATEHTSLSDAVRDISIPIEKPEKTGDKTEAGNYFVANYPPFSFWEKDQVSVLNEKLDGPVGETDLGLYFHIPFCRK
ncbi:MAG: hypothetical protein AAGH89_10850, partial [Verrucomicrobiota bacterium]